MKYMILLDKLHKLTHRDNFQLSKIDKFQDQYKLNTLEDNL